MKTMICCCLIGDFLDFFLAGFFIAWIPVGLLDHVKAKRPLVDGEVALVNCQSGGKEHRHVACAANGHPCPVLLTQRSATPLAAQTPSLCSWQTTINEHYATEIAYVQAVALFVCRFRLERGDEFFETRVTPKR